MRFDGFVQLLETEIKDRSSLIRMKKGKDTTGRDLHVIVLNGGKLDGTEVAKIGYTVNGYGQASRYVQFTAGDGSKSVVAQSGEKMANMIVTHLTSVMDISRLRKYIEQNS